MTTLKKSDVVEGMEVMINPEMSSTGRYGKYLGYLAEVVRVYSRWGSTSVDIKVKDDGKRFNSVGSQVLIPTSSSKETLIEALIDVRKTKIKALDKEILTRMQKIHKAEREIEYIEETQVTTFNKEEYQEWAISKLLEDDDLSSEDKKNLISNIVKG